MRFVVRLITLALVAAMLSPAPAMALREPPPADGLVVVESTHDFETTWTNLIGVLEANDNISLVTTIDHAAAAESVGVDLDPNRVVYFGNPALGTPLMQADRSVGIDLPQKMQVLESGGRVLVTYNPPSYLAARHEIDGVSALETIDLALATMASVATGSEVDTRVLRLGVISRYPGLVTVDSPNDIETTWSQLLEAIDASPASVATTVDHAANAAGAGLDLEPTRLVVFGNPQLGTPLMQESPTAGIDLPLKILVWEDEGGVHLTYTDPSFIRFRHRIADQRELIETMRGAIAAFIEAASAPPSEVPPDE